MSRTGFYITIVLAVPTFIFVTISICLAFKKAREADPKVLPQGTGLVHCGGMNGGGSSPQGLGSAEVGVAMQCGMVRASAVGQRLWFVNSANVCQTLCKF